MFQSTPSTRRATSEAAKPWTGTLTFQSTPSTRRATEDLGSHGGPSFGFNPRPPRGGRQSRVCSTRSFPSFQSTPSTRRATIHASRLFRCQDVSIHALHAEGDCQGRSHCGNGAGFNPRPPRGGRPGPGRTLPPSPAVSIHALHAEGDHTCCDMASILSCFNPRPPRGGRQAECAPMFQGGPCFNPRPPRGGRPVMISMLQPQADVSIHALHAEGVNGHPNGATDGHLNDATKHERFSLGRPSLVMRL